MNARFALLLLPLLAGGCAADLPGADRAGNDWALASANIVAPPIDCIERSRIRATLGRDDRTVDFTMDDGRTFRNRLGNQCPGLAFQSRFLFRTPLDRLCSTDDITLLDRAGRPGASCGLGRFQQVQIAERRP